MTGFTGTWTLVRFILRRDRVRTPIWIVGILFMLVGTALTLPGTFPTEEDLRTRAELVENPAVKLLLGPGHGLDNYTFGPMLSNEMLGITLIAVALMSVFMVVRHTRAEEESGRAELVGSSVVGRHAAMAAVLIVAAAVNIAIGGLTAISLTGSLEELDLSGSLLFGASMAVTGITFAAITAVSVQLNEFARGATGMASAALGALYVVRGFGDIQENFLSWMSPFGWALQTGPYVLDRWWPLVLSLGLSAILIGVAYALSVRRDVAAGVLPPRPGPATATGLLTTPMGLVLRLQRGSLIGWTVALAIFGIGVGSIVADAAEMYADNPTAQQFLEALGLDESAVIDSALSLYVSFFALVTSIFTVSVITRLRGEETSLRAENILATAVSRVRWTGQSLFFSVVASTFILAVAGIGAGLMYSMDTGNTGDIWTTLWATVSYAPSLWLAAGIAIAVFGLIPRLMTLAWAVPAYGLIILSIGPILGLPDWALELSPFEQVPRMPAVDFDPVPLLIMTAIAAALIAAGLYGVRHRDMDFV